MRLSKMTLLPLFAASVTTAVAAQQKDCTIDEGNPSQVARAMLQLQMAGAAKTPADAEKQLASSVKLLSEADPSRNPIGRNFVLGKTLVLWLSQPDVTPIMKRSTIGFTTNPDGTVDLVSAIDSAFSVVEASNPACAKETAPWRGQKGWVNLVNAAVEAVNNDKVDTAEVLAKRSLVLYKGAPYGYMVLGNVAQKRRKTAEAIQYYKQTIATAGTDTLYADLRRQLLLQLGNVAAEAADNAAPADKANLQMEAKNAFNTLLKDPGKPAMADAARQGLTKLALAAGDTAAFKATYKDQLANPGAYDYQQLMNAGVNAARADQVADAIALFKSAYAKNAYHRDVLYNLAIMYIKSGKDADAIPLIRQLVNVDPSNGENYRLFTFAYANMQKGLNAQGKAWADKNTKAPARDIKLKKLTADSANHYYAQAKSATDSALKYNDLADKAPAKVLFTEFTPHEDKTTLSGTITNNTDAAKSYTIKVEFLDKDGKVVSTQEATVGPVNPKATGRFSVTGTGTAIAAFRYAPVA